MKRAILLISAVFLLLTPISALAGGGNPDTCDTRYPVVLSHGMGATTEILGIIDYWWGIEDALEDEGCDLYFTSVNGMDSTDAKGAAFKAQLLEILAVSGSSKANVIGHSHGTIYTRAAISNMGMSGKVATHTSLAGPHRGSSIADIIAYDIPGPLVNLGTAALDLIYAWVFGDTDPDTTTNMYDLCTDYMTQTFNPNTPNMPGIYYQSWAAKAKWSCPSVILEPVWLIMLIYEGDNDGLVGVNSAKWGKYRGVEDAAWYSAGCDHLNIVGQLFGVTPGFDAPDFFVDVVSELKNKGY